MTTRTTRPESAEKVVRDIRRATRRQYSAEEKIPHCPRRTTRRGQHAELCRKEAIAQSRYYGWSKEWLEAGKRRLAGDTARDATSGQVKALRVSEPYGVRDQGGISLSKYHPSHGGAPCAAGRDCEAGRAGMKASGAGGR